MHPLPKYPDRSLLSKGILYRPLQDIEIYVEDENSEVFYTELLSRLISPKHKVHRVIALRGRENVLKGCSVYNTKRPALFIIDGDLAWVSGQPAQNYDHLFVHPCYCIENYLICEQAMVEIAFENVGNIQKELISQKLNWPAVVNEIKDPLVELFCEFAVAHLLVPTLKTTTHKLSSVFTQKRKKSPPEFDIDKFNVLIQMIRTDIITVAGKNEYNRTRNIVAKRIKSFSDQLDCVSGKDFLIPAAMFAIRRIVSVNIERESFMLRLARHCSLIKLRSLKDAMLAELGEEKSGSIPGTLLN